GSEHEPEAQACGGLDDSPGETSIASGAEVEDGAGAGKDLAQRFDLADEPERAGKCFDRNGSARGGESEVDEQEQGNQLSLGSEDREQDDGAGGNAGRAEPGEEPQVGEVGRVHTEQADRDREDQSG